MRSVLELAAVTAVEPDGRAGVQREVTWERVGVAGVVFDRVAGHIDGGADAVYDDDVLVVLAVACGMDNVDGACSAALGLLNRRRLRVTGAVGVADGAHERVDTISTMDPVLLFL